MILSFSPKSTTEKITLTFNFSTIGVMGGAELIISQTTIVEVQKGIDPTPANILNGPASLDPTHPHRILQRVQDGIEDVIYLLIMRVTTNFGNTYEMYRLLRIDNP